MGRSEDKPQGEKRKAEGCAEIIRPEAAAKNNGTKAEEMAEFSNRFLRGLNSSGRSTGRGDAGKMVLLVFFIFIPALIYVFFYMQSVTVKYNINELEKERDSLKSQNKMLEYRLHAALSGSAIEKVAMQRYGFKPANPEDIKVISKGSSLFAFLGNPSDNSVR